LKFFYTTTWFKEVKLKSFKT